MSITNLVAGICHEMNTPLGTINSAIDISNAALGWLGLILTLVKLGKWLKKTVEVSAEAELLVGAFEDAQLA